MHRISDAVLQGLFRSATRDAPKSDRHSALERMAEEGNIRKSAGIGGECLLFLAHGHNFPCTGFGATLSAWAEQTDDDGREAQTVGNPMEWRSRPGNQAPNWCISRPLGFVLVENLDVMICLRLSIQSQVYGSLAIPLKELLGKGLVTHELIRPPSADSKKGDVFEPPTVSFQIVDQHAVCHCRTVFFIRHAQSVWNAAQSSNNLYEMWKTKDHPLSQKGCAEAEALAERIQSIADDSKDTIMLRPDVVYCSPLTRAIQTAVIALQPVLNASGDSSGEIVLMSAAREKQNLGGLDSKGSACGATLVQRALDETRNLYRNSEDQSTPQSLGSLRFDIEEVQEKWWSKSASDSTEQMQERLSDFMSQLLYSPSYSIIVVGHSHFFRAVFKRYLSAELCQRRPHFVERLRTWKLSNCGVARVELDPEADFPIYDVELMLGTEMVPPRRGFCSRPRCCGGGSVKGHGRRLPSTLSDTE